MKSQFFKIILFSLLILTCLTPVCFGQETNNGGQADQNTEVSGEKEKPKNEVSNEVSGEQINKNTEVLGENERLPFMQTESSAVSNEPGSGSLLLRTLGAMILIVGLIFFGAWGLKKLGFGNLKAKTGEDAPDLEIINSVSLGSGRTISTVRFGERVLLVGSTAQSFTLLADESDKEMPVNSQPRSVAEMLAEQNDSFAAEFAQAEIDLDAWQAEGEKI